MNKIILVAALMIAIGFSVMATGQPMTKYCVQDQQQEDHIRAMMSDSLDQAFKDSIAHLFDIWVKSDVETPERAQRGSNNAISAYTRAQRGLSRWKPQRCGG